MSPTNLSGQPAIARPESTERTAARRQLTHTLSEVLVPMSLAVDLAEGRPAGHAQRVAYIAVTLGEALGLAGDARLESCYAGLFHDVGTVSAGPALSDHVRLDQRSIFSSLPLLTPEEAAVEARSAEPEVVVDRIFDHVVGGARAAQDLTLPAESVQAIACHHEQWDGQGYPHGLVGDEIPLSARVVTLADHLESLISHEISPLVARRNLPTWLARFSGTVADPELISAARGLTAEDSFWLGLYSATLANDLKSTCSRLREPRGNRLLPFAQRFAEIMDARFSFIAGVSARVADLSEALGRSLGLPDPRLKQLRAAALLHDIGQLGVSERIMAKPGILSVEEWDVLRQHPLHSYEVMDGIAGMEEASEWVLTHHERPDGRGYPEGISGADIPVEARILAIADAYVAITSDRPHRARAGQSDGVRQLRAAAGTQLDPELVGVFLSRVV